MPPSGYRQNYVQHILEFLNGCAAHLREENEPLGKLPDKALSGEIQSITTHLRLVRDGSKSDHVALVALKTQAPVMELTQRFYEKLKGRNIPDWDKWPDHVVQTLQEVEEDILAIHIPA